MPASNTQIVSLEELLLDLNNPRFVPRENQREALVNFATDRKSKLPALAKDILARGLNPSEMLIVEKLPEDNAYLVLEGNRRVAAMKLLSSADLVVSLGLPKGIEKSFLALQNQDNSNLPHDISCTVMTRAEARPWIEMKHTGENAGRGIVKWDGPQTQRFRGSSPSLELIDLLASRGYLGADTLSKQPRMPITTVGRILGNPKARALLGADVKKGQLVIDPNDDATMMRWALVVTEIAHKTIKVTDVDDARQQVNYAKEILGRPLPLNKPQDTANPIGTTGNNEQLSSQISMQLSSNQGQDAVTSKSVQRLPADRPTVIPKRLKLRIPQTRLNQMYYELQRLEVEDYKNACSVLLRVFVELTVEDFAHRHNISLKRMRPVSPNSNSGPKTYDMSLRDKVSEVVEYVEQNNMCSKDELAGVNALLREKNSLVSIESLNAYVHNMHYNPSPTDLKSTWDKIEVFIDHLWNG